MTDSVSSEQIYGIAKRMNAELEKLPMHTHATIIHHLSGSIQHRQIEHKLEVEQAQAEALRKQQEWVEAQQKKQEEHEAMKRFGLATA